MSKRFTKFLALLLSTAMVFTLNTTVFGKTGAGEVEMAEEESKEPEIVGLLDPNHIDPDTGLPDPQVDADSDYGTGFTAGKNAYDTDTANGNTEEYDKKIADFNDPEKNFTMEYKAGYYDGYEGKGHAKCLEAIEAGYVAGFWEGRKYDQKNAVSDFMETNAYKEPYKVQKLVAFYQEGFKKGVEAAEANMASTAYDRGYDFWDADGTLLGDLHRNYTTIDKYLASPDFETVKEHYKDYVDGYFAKYTEGLKAGFAYYSKTAGYREGKNSGAYDGRNLYTNVDAFDTEEKAQKYNDDILGAIAPDDNGYSYMDRWKIYNNKNESDDDGKTKGGIVGEEFIKYFKEGYNSNYKIAKKDSDRFVPKDRYCFGFERGYLVGTVDAENNNDKAKKKDLEADANDVDDRLAAGTTYHKFTETDKYSETNPNGNTEEEIKQYIAGFNFGYEAATSTKAYDDGYNKGYDSGEADAGRDQYREDIATNYQGYWEHDYPNSPYNIFNKIKNSSPYAKGYVEGYDDGYNARINRRNTGEELADVAAAGFDYTTADIDPWRASTDPAKWETAQLLINENDPGQTNKYYNNTFFDSRNFKTNNGDPVPRNLQFSNADGAHVAAGAIVATSPFQYYFDLYDKDHLVDKKTVDSSLKLNDQNVYVNGLGENRGSAGQYLYAAFSASSNKAGKPKKGDAALTGSPYVIIRYRLAGAETDENYKVRRYTYDKNGSAAVVVDHINNYYKGTDKNGAIVDEPVVLYDSRKIAGVKRDKDGNIENNDKSNRYIIDAEALLITWTEGQPATLIGGVDLNIKAKDNVNATVPAAFIDYLGDTAMLQDEMVNPQGYTNDVPILLKETDRPVVPDPANDTYDTDFAAGNGSFSKYYEVTKANSDGSNERKGETGVITFKGTQSVPKLTAPAKGVTDLSNANAYMSKKGSSPVFTLKAGKLDPSLKAYSKDIKMALKNAELHFEISRMKIASDYVSTIDSMGQDGDGEAPVYVAPAPQNIEFKYEDTVLAAKLNPLYPVEPRRSECGSLEEYQKKVEEYRKAFNVYNRYINSEEFKALYRAEFKKAVEAYRAEYKAIVAKYSSKLDYMQKWIDERWGPANLGLTFNGSTGPHAAPSFPYTVTKDDRTYVAGGVTRIAPVGRNEVYRALVPEDADCDGIITAVEHYEYTRLRPNWPDDVDDPRFNGKLEAGDNIVAYNVNFIEDEGFEVIFDTVGCVPVGDRNHKITGFNFTYDVYDVNGDRTDGIAGVTVATDHNGKYYYGDAADADGNNVFLFQAFIDFLEDQETDIGFVEDGHDPRVLWPGAEALFTATGANDTADIVFSDPMIKAGKKTASGNSAAMTVKATLNTTVFNGWLVEPFGPIPGTANVERQEKKLKVFIPKADKNGVVTIKKLPKADLKMEQKMAETEPFVVVTGINNYEGCIAIRQRKNGDLGYGYYKNDDFYYLFSEEE